MPDENTVGGVSVDVTANLGTYKADMAAAKATAADLDTAFSKLTVNSQNMVRAMVDAGVSTKAAADTFGKTAEGLQRMAAFTELASKSKMADTAATAANTAATATSTAAHAANTATVVNSRVAYEGLVAVHEILSGRFNRLAGTSMILGQAMLGNAKTAELLKMALSPVGAAIAGITAITIAGGVALYQYEKQQRDLMVSSAGLGAASGISSSQANQLSGNGLISLKSSINDNLKATESYTAAGVRNASTLRELNAVTQDFALLTGEKAKDAQKELAEAMKDPVKGAADLNSKLSILDGTQLQNVKSLTELGDKMEAQAIITDALKRRTDEAKDAGVEQDSIFHKIAVGASDAATGIGKLVDAELKWGGALAKTLTTDAGAIPRQIQADKDRIAAEARLQDEARNRADSAAGFAVQQETPEAKAESERNKLLGQRNTLIFARNADEKLGNADGIKANAAALNDVNRALDTYEGLAKRAAAAGLSPDTEKKVELDRLEAQASKAKTEAQKTAIAQQKEALELSGKVMSQADAAALIASAGQRGGARARDQKDTFGAEIREKQAEAEAELGIAAAYGVSDAAAMKAAAAKDALAKAAKDNLTAAQRELLLQTDLNLAAAKAAAEQAKKAADIEAETTAHQHADALLSAGLITRKEAEEQIRNEVALRPIEAAAANASAKEKETLTAVLKRLTAAQKDYNAELGKEAADDLAAKDRDEIAVARLRTGMSGQPRAKQDSAVARLQRSQTLGPTVSATAAGQASIQSAGDVASAKATEESTKQFRDMGLEIEKETTALQKQQATLGMTLEQADRYNTEQKLLLEAERDQIEITDEVRQKIDGLATSYAHASQEARALAQHQKGLGEAAKTVADDFESQIEAVVFDGKKIGEAGREIAKSLGKDALKANLTGEGPLAGFFGTDKSSTVGGMNGGVLSQLAGSVFGVGKGGSAKPSGSAGDPLFVKSVDGGGSASGGGGGGILGMVKSLFGGGAGMGGMGGAPGEDIGGSLSELAGLFHAGTSYVGTPHRQISVPSKLFLNAPRLHRGLAPDEFPAILQHGEGVTPRSGRAPRGGRNVTINIASNDPGTFGRSRRQIERAMDRSSGRRG